MTSRSLALRTATALFAVLAFAPFAAPTARAGETLALSPVLVEKVLQPGATFTDVVRVINTGTTTVKIDKSVADFYYDARGSVQFVEEKDPAISTSSLKSWMKIETDAFTLAPGDTKVIPYTITVPANAEPGGHYGVLFFNTVPDANVGGATVVLSGRVGSLVLVEIPGNVQKTGTITSFKAGQIVTKDNAEELLEKGFFERAPISFAFSVKNTGNSHFIPDGTIDIKNMLGRTVESLPAQKEEKTGKYRAFPGVDKTIFRTWEPGFLFGRYTATINITDGTGKKLEPLTVSFVVFPWKETIGFLLITIVVISLIVQLIKRYNAHVIAKARHQKS